MKAAGKRGELLGALAVAGPVLFTVAWLLAWQVQNEYSPRREEISALAALDAQHAWIMIVGFLAFGVGTLALGLALPSTLRRGVTTTIGASFVLLAAVGILVAGPARLDCSDELAACRARVDAGDVSWHHQVHIVASGLVFLSLVIAQLVLARAFHRDGHWSDLRSYSVASGIATLVLLALYVANVAQDWDGIMQRIFLAVPLAWIVVLGMRVHRRSAGAKGAPLPASRRFA